MFDSYTETILIFAGINIVLAYSQYATLSAGLISLGQGGFMAIGAYTATAATLFYNLPFPVALLLSGLVAGAMGVVVGFPALRIKGIYLALLTLGFGEMVRVFFLNFEPLGASAGIVGISPLTELWMIYLIAAFWIYFFWRVAYSRIGRAFIAVGGDEGAAEMLGVNLTKLKLLAFALGAFIAGVGGALYAHYALFIESDNFGFDRSIEIFIFVVFGGMETIWGPLAGAFILTVLPEFFRAIQEWRLVFYGCILIVMMILRPDGLIGRETFRLSSWRIRKRSNDILSSDP